MTKQELNNLIRMRDVMKEEGLSTPMIEVGATWFAISFSRIDVDAGEVAGVDGVQSGVQIGVQSGVQSDMASNILRVLTDCGELGKKEIALALGKARRTRYLNEQVRWLLDNGLIERTIPDKPTSRLQKYRIARMEFMPRQFPTTCHY